VTGEVLNKAQQIRFSSTQFPASDLTKHFEGLQLRVYGDVGIVNGLVVTTKKDGNTASKTAFTDVFVNRDGRWQAVNAQENAVQSSEH
jgi:ketosteroid isomerase-like protein